MTGICPGCGKEGAVILNNPAWGGGYVCWPKKGGCGQRFQNFQSLVKTTEELPIEETELDQIDFVDRQFREQFMAYDKTEKIELLRRRYRTDLYALCCEVLGMEDLRLNPKLFRRMAQWATTWQPHKFIKICLAARGFFKTSICNEGRCIQEILNDPQAQILNGRSVQENAEGTVKAIRSHIDQNRVLKFLYPEIRPGNPWSVKKFSVKRPFDTQACTMEAWGIGASQTSLHYGHGKGSLGIVLDDLEDKETANSEITRVSSKEAFYYCFHLLNPGSYVMVIGTRYPEDDMYGWVMDNPEMRDYIDCLVISAEDEDEHSAFPQRFSDEFLHVQKILNFWLYSAQMLQRPITQKNAVFSKELIEKMYFDVETLDTSNMTSGFMWDPGAASDVISAFTRVQKRKTRGHGFSLTVGYKNHKDDLYVTHAYRKKFEPTAQANFVLEKAVELKPMYILVEADVLQGAYVSLLRERRDELGLSFAIRPITSKHTTKVHRIDQMASIAEAGKIKIARGLTTLVAEMVDYKGGDLRAKVVDCLDGVAYLKAELPRASADPKELLEEEKRERTTKLEKRVPKGDIDMAELFEDNESLTERELIAASG